MCQEDLRQKNSQRRSDPLTSTYFEKCDILITLPPPDRQKKGGVSMGDFSSFLLAVVAGIVAYYICKWLDSEK